MGKNFIKIAILFFLTIYGTVVFASSETTIENKPNFPELPIADNYINTVGSIIESILESAPPNIDKSEQRKRIKAHIYGIVSVKEFESMIIDGEQLLIDGHNDGNKRDLPEYKEKVDMVNNISNHIAMVIAINSLDIYFRKFIKKDPITQPLFEASKSNSDDQIISWIDKEISLNDLPEGAINDFVIEPSDKIYTYMSPPFSWENLFGRSGYAIFRNNILIKSTISTMN